MLWLFVQPTRRAKLFSKLRKAILKSFQDRHNVWNCTLFFLSSFHLRNLSVLNRKMAVRVFVLVWDVQKIQSYRGGDTEQTNTGSAYRGYKD